MKKPLIFAVDDDPQVLQAIVRDLRAEYRKNYRIVSTESANQALEALKEFKLTNQPVALFLSDQRMPEMLGVDFLERAMELYPDAKRVLLTAYSDIEAAIKAINDVQLDYYLMKPWDPPEEKLYPVLNEYLDIWQAGFRPQFDGIKVAGYQWSPKSHDIKEFLAGNLVPYRWFDVATSEEAKQLVSLAELGHTDLPAVFFEDGSHLKDPDVMEVARKIGMRPEASEDMYDVVIIGAGPAGLAAAVYGASEGLKTLLIEKRAPGGQAGTSSRIENYLGFPTGLSGAELTRRALTQATRLGAEFLSPQEVAAIRTRDTYKILTLSDGSEVKCRSVITTTGVDYRRLETKGIEDFTGAGVYYGAASTEAAACQDGQVYVAGGGNSAGQAAMYLAKFAGQVHIIIRRDSLSYSMSQYLVEQIANTENIEVLTHTVVVEASGEDRLSRLTLENVASKERRQVDASALFIFIGAKPYTEWIPPEIIRNERGFLETGNELKHHDSFRRLWKLDREPLPLETSSPGIFAAGDVRAGAMNRVASAVGEGSMAIKLVHEYLASL